MPFAISTPSNLADAITHLADFYENTMGWTVNHDVPNSTATVSIPGKPAVFTLSKSDYVLSNSSGGVDFEVLIIDVTNIATPIRATVNWLNPITTMHVHADDAGPEPWSLITFQSAPEYYHHGYFGYVEKFGSYNGGAIADGTNWYVTSNDSYRRAWDYDNNHMLFSGGFWTFYESDSRGQKPGGIEIDHVDAANGSYVFTRDSTYNAGGGWANAHNGTLAWVEPSGADGSINMHPPIIFANLAGDNFVTPVGCPPGVRMINCAPFELGQVVTIGGIDWQVFPMCNKTAPYEGTNGDGSGPGNIQPDPDDGVYRYNIGGGTERWGIAVLHEA